MTYLPRSALKSTLILVAASCFLLLLSVISLNSLADESAVTARRLSESGEILPLEKILRVAKSHKNGKVLETELERRNNRYIYEVEILDENSQVWEIKLDAKTGKLIKLERDD